MRVISGLLKGRRFSGKIPDNIRPTTDATKESIFNVLSNYIDFEDLLIADICAGTGAYGIECISRSAELVYFFEINKKTSILIEEILNSFQISEDKYEIILGDAIKNLKLFGNKLNLKFNLVFMDPPYKSKICNEIIFTLLDKKMLLDDSILVVEHHNNEVIMKFDDLELLNSKNYSETVVDILQYKNEITY